MNIVQILPSLDSGGVETGTVDLARALIAKGHRAIVISRGGRLVPELEKMGAIHYTLPVHRKEPLTMLFQISRVAEILRKERADLIHARSRVPAWIAYFSSRVTQVKFVTTCHGWYRSKFGALVMGWAQRVIVASSSIGRHMTDDFGVGVRKIRLIRRGVDLERFHFRERPGPKRGGPVIGMIGRITPLKGHEFLIRAVAPLISKFPGIKLKVIGSAPAKKPKYRETLEDLIARLGLNSVVQFLGDRDDIPHILKGLDLLVMPTITPEAFGRVIIEAQAVGVPVIASRIGGLQEVINHNVTGFLVPPQDPDALARAIEYVVGHPGEIEQVVQNARKKVEAEYPVSKMVNEIINVYEEVIAEKKIAVFKLSALGDVILATPSLRMIHKRFPEAEISVVTDPAFASLVSSSPYVHHVISYDKKRAGRSLKEFLRFSEALRTESFDMTVDFQNNSHSHWLAFLSGAPLRYGYKRKVSGRLLNRGIAGFEKRLPPVEHQFQLLQELGIEHCDSRLELWTTPRDGQSAKRLIEGEWISDGQLLVGIHAGGSGRWESKRWPIESFAKLGDLLAKRLGARVVLTGDPGEVAGARRLASLMNAKPINTVGKTSLTELIEVIRLCHVFVTGDSAPLHIASAVETPLVALFGPTDPLRHMPPGKGHRVHYLNIRCSPCYSAICPKGHHRCLRDISPEEVMESVEAQAKALKVKT